MTHWSDPGPDEELEDWMLRVQIGWLMQEFHPDNEKREAS